jgi:hypothetical protein
MYVDHFMPKSGASSKVNEIRTEQLFSYRGTSVLMRGCVRIRQRVSRISNTLILSLVLCSLSACASSIATQNEPNKPEIHMDGQSANYIYNVALISDTKGDMLRGNIRRGSRSRVPWPHQRHLDVFTEQDGLTIFEHTIKLGWKQRMFFYRFPERLVDSTAIRLVFSQTVHHVHDAPSSD